CPTTRLSLDTSSGRPRRRCRSHRRRYRPTSAPSPSVAGTRQPILTFLVRLPVRIAALRHIIGSLLYSITHPGGGLAGLPDQVLDVSRGASSDHRRRRCLRRVIDALRRRPQRAGQPLQAVVVGVKPAAHLLSSPLTGAVCCIYAGR